MSRSVCVLLAAALLLGLASSACAADHGQFYVRNTTNYYVTVGGFGISTNTATVTLPRITIPPRSVNPNPVQIGYVPYGRYYIYARDGYNRYDTPWVYGTVRYRYP